MSPQLPRPLLILGTLALASAGASAQQLDILGFGRAQGITPDGSTVLGSVGDDGSPVDTWFWTDVGGGSLTTIGGEQAKALSFDAWTVLGGGNASGWEAAMLWSNGSGWSSLGGFGPDCQGMLSVPSDLSWDGSTAVGLAYNGCTTAPFKWTSFAGLTPLPTIGTSARPYAISGSGDTIGGWDGSGFNIRKACIWFPDGTQKLILVGVAPNLGGQGEVHGFNSDGTIAVGGAEWISGLGAFKWDAVNGPQYLGELPGTPGAMGVAVSEDGKTVVGNSGANGGFDDCWIWTKQDGMRSVDTVLADLGLAFPSGGSAFYVSDMTPDGRKLTGAFKTSPGGAEMGFLLTLPDPCGFTEYGAGAAPANVLSLSGTGSTSVGATPTFVTAGASSANVVVALSLGSGSLPLAGGMLLVDASKVVATLTVPVVAGTASLPLPLPINPNLAGTSLFLQSLSFDPTQPGWLAFSNGLDLTICP